MPTYQYQCRDCGHGFEQFQKFSDDPLTECPSCQGTIQRVIQNVGVVFKGTGWYINDSRKPAGEKATAAGKTDSPESKSPAETSKASEPAKMETPKAVAAAD